MKIGTREKAEKMQAEYEERFHSMQQEMERRQTEFKYTLDAMEESNSNINNNCDDI